MVPPEYVDAAIIELELVVAKLQREYEARKLKKKG